MSENGKYTVIVTGGTRGIGRAICRAFANPETHIFFNYVSSDPAAREVEKEIADAGGTATGIRADIASEDEVAAFFKTVLRESGRIDVLVNNAGIARDGLVVRMKVQDWDAVLNTNLKGAFNCIKQAAKPMMKQRQGRIINITSIVGVTGNPGQANYVASKSGLIGLTKAVAKELAPRNITVNAIAPGFIETDMTASLTDEIREAMISQIPLGRSGKPEDVAEVALFLASPRSDYITGQVIHVNGGMYV